MTTPAMFGAAFAAAVVTVAAVGAAPVTAATADPLRTAAADLRAGRYEQARKAADALSRRKGVGARAASAAAILAARAERHLGLAVEARRRLEEATVRAPDDLPLRAELIRVAHALGDRGAVQSLVSQSYDDWEGSKVDKNSAANLIAMSVALRHDNNWKDANDLLRRAAKADEGAVEANLEWGETFLEKHSADNAVLSYRDVLARDPQNPDAHVGMARAELEQGYDGAAAERAVTAALAVNPRHAGALGVRGEIALDAEELDTVAAVVAQIRRTNARDEGAAWLAAARALLMEDRATFEREKQARLTARPADADFLTRTAEALVRHRRYDEAAALAREAVTLEPKHARALSSLGNTLLRLGDEAEGIATLRRAWDRDPYDARTYNLLNLFEKVIPSKYVTVATENLRFRVEPAARRAVEAVVGPFLEETYRKYVERYGFAPKGPIIFELYGDPSHYAVRTVGLPRLGVTAVCFGRVITSQAPTNGAYNWGMVLAHELAHVFALQLSAHRVPRWFTEGLSELESARLRPEWRRHGELTLAAALARNALHPIDRLSQAFVRARTMDAAANAYMHAALAVEFLETRFGFPKLRDALVAWGRGERGPAVVERATAMDAASLDRAFREWLGGKLAPYRDQYLPAQAARLALDAEGDPRSPRAIAERGLRAMLDGDARGAAAALAKARAEKGDDPAVQFLAAELALAGDDPRAADTALRALIAKGHDGYDVRLRLALASLRLRDQKTAEAELRRAVAMAPEEVEARTLLAELLGATGRAKEKLAEEEAIVRREPQTAALAKRVVLENARQQRSSATAELAAIALFIDPADADVHGALGRALAATGKTDGAIPALERALLFGADPAPVHRTLAELHARRGDSARAAKHRAAAVSSPSIPRAPDAPGRPRAPGVPGQPPPRATPESAPSPAPAQ